MQTLRRSNKCRQTEKKQCGHCQRLLPLVAFHECTDPLCSFNSQWCQWCVTQVQRCVYRPDLEAVA